MMLDWISDRVSGYASRFCIGYVRTHWLVGYLMTLSVAYLTIRRVIEWLMSNKVENMNNQAVQAWFKVSIPEFFWKN
jgi:hypothetical protein